MSKWTVENLPEVLTFVVIYEDDEEIPEEYEEGKLFKAIKVTDMFGRPEFIVIWTDDKSLKGLDFSYYPPEEIVMWLNNGDWKSVDEGVEEDE